MMTMIEQQLQALGLSHNEAKVYLELVRQRQSTGGVLIKATGLHRNIIYDNMEKLIEKGLASYIVENNRKVFVASQPDALLDFIAQEQKNIDKKKQLATEIASQIVPLLGRGNVTHEAVIIRGVHALKQELNSVFAHKVDYISFGAPQHSTTVMGAAYWKNFSQNMVKHNVRGKLLFNESLRSWATQIRTKQHEIRFLEKEFEPLTQTIVYADTTLIVVWVDKPIATIIRSSEVARNYTQFFTVLWKNARS